MLREPVKDTKEETEDCSACRQCDTCCDNCCCSFWSWVLIILFLMGGFAGTLCSSKTLFQLCNVKDYVKCQLLGGVIAGAIWQQNGFLREIGQKFPALNRITDYYSNNYYRDNYYNNYNSYNSYYGQQGYDQRPQYIGGDQNNNNPNNGRTRVILPGVL